MYRNHIHVKNMNIKKGFKNPFPSPSSTFSQTFLYNFKVKKMKLKTLNWNANICDLKVNDKEKKLKR